MNENQELGLTQEMAEYLNKLVEKANVTNEKTESHSNVHLLVDGVNIPMRVDDVPLLYIGCKLLPNIANYLVNILPQFIYPYVVAYLQDLSEMRDDPVTINELFNYLKEEK